MIKCNLILLSRSGMAVVPAAGGAEPAGPVPAALPGANRPHTLAETGTQIRRINPPPFFFSFCIPYLNIVPTNRRNLMAELRIRDGYPGFEFFPLRIRIFFIPDPYKKKLSIFNPKKWFLSSRKYDPGCSSRIRILTFYPSRIQGSKRHRIPDPQHCLMALFQASNFLAVREIKTNLNDKWDAVLVNPYSTFRQVIYQQCSQESLLNAYAVRLRYRFSSCVCISTTFAVWDLWSVLLDVVRYWVPTLTFCETFFSFQMTEFLGFNYIPLTKLSAMDTWI